MYIYTYMHIAFVHNHPLFIYMFINIIYLFAKRSIHKYTLSNSISNRRADGCKNMFICNGYRWCQGQKTLQEFLLWTCRIPPLCPHRRTCMKTREKYKTPTYNTPTYRDLGARAHTHTHTTMQTLRTHSNAYVSICHLHMSPHADI